MSGPADGAATIRELTRRVACVSSMELDASSTVAGVSHYVLRMKPKSGQSALLRMSWPNHFNIYFLMMWLFRDVKIRLTLPETHQHATARRYDESEKFLALTNVELLCAQDPSLHQADIEPLYIETDPDGARDARCFCGKEGLTKTFPILELTTDVVFLVGEECKELVRMVPREDNPRRKRLFAAVRRSERAKRASENALRREEEFMMAVVLPFVPRGQGFAGRIALGQVGLYRQYSAIKASSSVSTTATSSSARRRWRSRRSSTCCASTRATTRRRRSDIGSGWSAASRSF